MKSALRGVLCVGILVLASGVARGDQCPRDPNASRGPVGSVGGATAADFYYSAGGTLVEAHALEGFIVLDIESQGEIRFPLDAGFRMSADKRTRLHGIKALELVDFQRGDRVEVKFSSFDGRVVQLKLKGSGK